MRILISRYFAYAKFRENNTLVKISKFTVPQVELTFYASQTVLIISADGHAYTRWLPLLTDTASTSVVGVRDPGVPYHLFGIFSARIWRQKCPICRNDNDIRCIMKNTLMLTSSLMPRSHIHGLDAGLATDVHSWQSVLVRSFPYCIRYHT